QFAVDRGDLASEVFWKPHPAARPALHVGLAAIFGAERNLEIPAGKMSQWPVDLCRPDARALTVRKIGGIVEDGSDDGRIGARSERIERGIERCPGSRLRQRDRVDARLEGVVSRPVERAIEAGLEIARKL